MKRIFFIALFVFMMCSIDSQAADWYVRPSGGSGAGTSWTASWNGMNGIKWSSVSCGDTIWVAGGTYSSNLNPQKACTSGSQLYIRRARSDASACTTAAGWNAAYDSLVLQNKCSIVFLTDTTANYITISGRTTESGGGYGWKTYVPAGTGTGNGISMENNATSLTYLTLEYMEVAGPVTTSNPPTGDARGIDDSPYQTTSSNHTFSHMSVHGWESGIYSCYGNNHTFEYIDMYDIYGTSSIHPNLFYIIGSDNGIIRYSKFHDSAASGTGVAFSDGGSFANWKIYGSLFYDMMDSYGTAIGVQDAPITGLKIFNNVFSNNYYNINLASASCGSGCETKNNIFHGSGGSFSCGTTSNNLTTSDSSIFVNRAAKDFHLVSSVGSGLPRNAGTSESSYFSTDMDGTTFGGDGTWDIGAYEYSSIITIKPSTPTQLRIVAQ